VSIPAKRDRTAFFCSQCGAQHPRWQGQCRECGEWNSLIEERTRPIKSSKQVKISSERQFLSQVGSNPQGGLKSGISELDRVLGGNLHQGMSVLLGGEPGIGKSTIILQAAEGYAKNNVAVLYVTGEESAGQIKMRAERLGVFGDGISVVNSTSLEEITSHIDADQFGVVLVDSIQTTCSDMFDSPAGSVSQVRESANRLIQLAREKGYALFLVGHVTKDGMVAGPKVLEHMVDTVLYFEGDVSHIYRILRATKNRFGSVSEIGVFEMTSGGLAEVSNPSSLFLAGFGSEARTGSVVAAICEGSRPLLVEVQALVTPANYGNPQRVAGGIDNKRLALLLAILEKRCDYALGTSDVFVSIAGGLRLSEPALDLSVMTAVASSLTNRIVDSSTLVIGEVGLSGEVRGVTAIERRIAEASRMGFKRMILPQSSLEQTAQKPLELIGVSTVQAALEAGMN